MIAFKKMWSDVEDLISRNTIGDFCITEKCSDGFVVEDNSNSYFVGKQDFVDFWCNMLYFEEIPIEELRSREEPSFKYVYAVIKHLPYIRVNSGIMKVLE